LRELATANADLGVQNLIVDVPSIDRKHLACHALVALVPTFAIFEEAFAGFFDRYLVRSGAIGPGLHLAFDVDAEGVGGFLVWEMLSLSSAVIVGIIDNSSGFGFTRRSRPSALADRCHCYRFLPSTNRFIFILARCPVEAAPFAARRGASASSTPMVFVGWMLACPMAP
jgi:hypothetical protein